MDDRLTVLLDVCDVVIDLKTAVIREAGLHLEPANCTQWDIFNLIGQDECARVMALFDDPAFWCRLQPVPGALEGIEGLRGQGYRVHFLTSPWWSCENWEGIRRDWLAERFPWFHRAHDMTVTSEKFRFDGDILVDDRPKHVKLWQAKHPMGQAWAFDTQFNQFFRWPRRCTWCPTGFKEV